MSMLNITDNTAYHVVIEMLKAEIKISGTSSHRSSTPVERVNLRGVTS